MPRVPAVLLDQVAQEPAQAGMVAVGVGHVNELVESAVDQGYVEPSAGPPYGGVPERVSCSGVSAAEVNSSVVDIPIGGVPRHARWLPAQLGVEVEVLDEREMLEQGRRLSEEAPMDCSPAASRSSAFQRKVARSRSSAPTRCSTSVPATGGSRGVAIGHGATVDLAANIQARCTASRIIRPARQGGRGCALTRPVS